MQNLLKTLEQVLQKDDRLVIDGVLAKNKIMELALALDASLLKLLLSDVSLKEHFFTEVDKTLVFDKQEFIRFVNNKNFLPDSYTSFKNKIGLMKEDGTYMSQSKDVVLAFPYKDCVLEGGQDKEDAKRKEIFWNTTLAPDEIDRLLDPKVFTNFKKYDKDGEKEVKMGEVDFEKENLIIKGNNLLALHSIEKRYAGKVKLIYIDPPFNTEGAANTFSYNNTFNHSSWLTFMRNRLKVSKLLLDESGLLVIAIDHAELLYLGVLADEIFERKNRIGVVAVETNPRGRSDSKYFATSSEFFLVYAKNEEAAKINPLPLTPEQEKAFSMEDSISKYRLLPFQRSGSNSTPDKRPNLFYPIYYHEDGTISLEKMKDCVEILPRDTNGKDRVWRQGKNRCIEAIENGDLIIKNTRGKYAVHLKDRIKVGRKPKTIWTNPSYDASSHGTILLQKMFGENVFSYPKSIHLIKDILKITTDKDDIILDFFGGSGTTAHAALELNKEDGGDRKFILVEQMDYVDTVTTPRVAEVIKNNNLESDFIYCELQQLNQSFADEIQSAKSTKELLGIWEDMQKQGFLSYRLDAKAFDDNAEEFKNMKLEEQQKILLSVLDHNHLYVNYSEMEDAEYAVSDKDKALNTSFYAAS